MNVWQERAIYDKNQISEWKTAIGHRNVAATVESKTSASKSKPQRSSGSKSKRESEKDHPDKKKKVAHSSSKPVSSSSNRPIQVAPTNTIVKQPVIVKQVPPPPRDGVIIDPDVLIKAMQELENAASGDSVVREKIASLPPEVSDTSLLDKIRDKDAAAKLSSQVDVACSLLADYNVRLVQEQEHRKQVSIMLSTYIKNQKDQLSLSEQKISEFKDKMKRVTQVRSELKSHLQNLPDLSLLPSVTGGLAPLPSAGDLFNEAAARMAYAKHPSSMGSTSSASPSTSSPADYETILHTPNS